MQRITHVRPKLAIPVQQRTPVPLKILVLQRIPVLPKPATPAQRRPVILVQQRTHVLPKIHVLRKTRALPIHVQLTLVLHKPQPNFRVRKLLSLMIA